MKKICLNCLKSIKKKEEYFEVNEFKNEKIIETKYLHKKCNEEMNKNNLQNKVLQEGAMKFINNANNFLKQMGMQEVVRI